MRFLKERFGFTGNTKEPSLMRQNEWLDPVIGEEKEKYERVCEKFLSDEQGLSTEGFNRFFESMTRLLGADRKYDDFGGYTAISHEIEREKKVYIVRFCKAGALKRGLFESGDHGEICVSRVSEEGAFKIFNVDTTMYLEEVSCGPHIPHEDGRLGKEREPMGFYTANFVGDTPSFVSVITKGYTPIDFKEGELEIDRRSLKELCAEVYGIYKNQQSPSVAQS